MQAAPCTVYWAPLPPISWILPLVGHVAVSDAAGNVYDFAASHTIGRNAMMGGPPSRCVAIPVACGNDAASTAKALAAWDEAIAATNEAYSRASHSLLFNNCHSHVAAVLNRAGRGPVNMFSLYWLLLTASQPVDRRPALRSEWLIPLTAWSAVAGAVLATASLLASK